MTVLPRGTAVVVFLSFALAYFLSALVRAITATLSPTLTQEFGLSARDLGLLAGGYFLGFAITQLPLGTWLDRWGPKRVILGFLAVGVLGCLAFSAAGSFASLLGARVLTGIGVSACLMAPLTGFRRWLTPEAQLRANSWMLMTGSLGMVASTLPVQWLLPVLGWRPLFWGLAGLVAVSMLVIALRVPTWQAAIPAANQPPAPRLWSGLFKGYGEVWRHRYFLSLAPLGFFSYGGLVAMQTLWAGPWMSRVAGYSAVEAATGLFWINVCMLATFWSWGLLNPWLARRGWKVERLISWGLPISFLLLGAIIMLGPRAGAGWWAAYCMSCTFVSLSQPAVGMAFPSALAGRALSAFNLVVFAGVFCVQWGVGLGIDGMRALGLDSIAAFQASLLVFLALCVVSWLWFLATQPHNRVP